MKMSSCSLRFLSCLIVICGFFGSDSYADTPARVVVHLLDYLAKDYSGAVENGVVKSEGEYSEQLEFSKTVTSEVRSLDELAKDSDLVAGLERLAALIATKADAKEVSVLARKLQTRIIQLSHLEISPSRWPNLDLGRTLYETNCTGCHGERGYGDGPAGVGLDPKPANFMSEQASEPPVSGKLSHRILNN